MDYFIDISVDRLNKFNEELCGDHVEITKNENSTIIVLSDGLGSGVKANILSTLTSNIASTMLKLGSDVFEVIETLEKTLPVCKVRGLAYSTFTIIQIFNDGRIYIVEFDNPRVVYTRDGKLLKLNEKRTSFQGKNIIESSTIYKKGDIITALSDGVVHAGIERFLDLGWQWDEIVDVLLIFSAKDKTSKYVSKEIIDICNTFYGNQPGDDATCVAIKIRDSEEVTLFSGPPKEKEKDIKLMKDFKKMSGIKIICGGTAANIASRILNKPIETDLSTMTNDVPPIACIEGIDLVTEGVLTLTQTVRILEEYMKPNFNHGILKENNGACILANYLINECTHLTVLIGNAINPAHQNPYFPDELSIKWKITQQLIETVEKLGKEVTIKDY